MGSSALSFTWQNGAFACKHDFSECRFTSVACLYWVVVDADQTVTGINPGISGDLQG
jgi:hypothetical protein